MAHPNNSSKLFVIGACNSLSRPAPKLNQLYKDFFDQSHLTPQQKEKLMSIFHKYNSIGARISNSNWETQREKDIQALLGDNLSTRLKNYEETIEKRAEIYSFKEQLSISSQPLQDYQVKQMLEIIGQEKKLFPEEEIKNLSDPQKILDYQKAFNQRIQNRLTGVLNTDQFNKFSAFQEKKFQETKLLLELAKQMEQQMGLDISQKPSP